MFDFFKIFKKNVDVKRQQDSHDDADILARISYLVKKGGGGGLIDIELNDYNDESIEALCKILNILGNEAFFVDTINMIKTSLISEGHEELLIKILTSISSNIKQKIINDSLSQKINEPCIKPSDML